MRYTELAVDKPGNKHLRDLIGKRVDLGQGETGVIVDAEMYDDEPDYLIEYDKENSRGETVSWHRRQDFFSHDGIDKVTGGAE